MALFLFFAAFVVDRLTKVMALTLFSDSIVFNQKTLFLFGASQGALAVFFIFAAILGWWFLHELLHDERSSFVPFGSSLMAAGTLSNFYDAHAYGAIIDWINVPGITAFNLADISIVAGSAVVLVSFFVRKTV